jgi:hypothetical protein
MSEARKLAIVQFGCIGISPLGAAPLALAGERNALTGS